MTARLVFVVALTLGAVTGVGPVVTAAGVDTDSVEVILAVDTSGSMAPAIDAARSAAKQFVASMPEGVAIGLEAFGDEVSVRARPTTDRGLLVREIDAVVVGGDTVLFDAVVSAARHFRGGVEHRVIVLLSDGADEGSTSSLEGALAELAARDVIVEAISLTTADTDLGALDSLGTVTSVDDPTGVAAAFSRISDLLQRVVVTTVPPTTNHPDPAPPTTGRAVLAPEASVLLHVESSVGQGDRSTAGSTLLWLGAAGVFGGLLGMGLLFVPRDRVSRARFEIGRPPAVNDLGARPVSVVDEMLDRHGRLGRLASALSVAGISVDPARFVGLTALLATVGGLVGLVIAGPLLALAIAVAVLIGARISVRRAMAERRRAFADQLPDVLQLVTTALSSGFGLTQALESVTEEAHEPARSEFGQVLVEMRLGRDQTEAMRSLAERMESDDLEWVVGAIDINRDTGGNLSEILGTVGATIRERQRMERQVATLTSEGRLSVRILTVIPVVMALWQWRTNPDNLALLTSGGGLVALVSVLLLMLVGTFWARRIVRSVGS